MAFDAARSTLSLALLALSSGCAQILGIDPWGAGGGSATGAGGATATSTGATPTTCADTSQLCVHPPSAGWSQVAAMTVTDTPCSGAFGVEVAIGRIDLVGDPATCGCACDPPMGQSCGKAAMDLWNESSCTTKIGTVQVDATCASSLGGVALNALGATVTPPTVVPGTCTPKPTKSVPAAKSAVTHVCQLAASGGACEGGGTCAPQPGGDLAAALCIWSAGDHPCPGGDFTNKTLVYRGPDADTRDCTACTCVPPVNAACTASATVFASGNCATPKAMTSGACTAVTPAGVQSASAIITLVPGDCTPMGGAPTGDLAGTDPITVCCTNPLS